MTQGQHAAPSFVAERDPPRDIRRTLLASPLAGVHEITCLRAQRGLSCEECKAEHALGLTLSGANVHHVEGRAFTASASHVMLSNRGQPYRVSHPFGSGEVQLAFMPREDLLIDLLAARDPTVQHRRARPFREHQLPVGPTLRLARRARRGDGRDRRSHAQCPLCRTRVPGRSIAVRRDPGIWLALLPRCEPLLVVMNVVMAIYCPHDLRNAPLAQ